VSTGTEFAALGSRRGEEEEIIKVPKSAQQIWWQKRGEKQNLGVAQGVSAALDCLQRGPLETTLQQVRASF